jgi:hypothetical protein
VKLVVFYDVTPRNLVDVCKGEKEPAASIFRTPDDRGVNLLRKVGARRFIPEDSYVQRSSRTGWHAAPRD